MILVVMNNQTLIEKLGFEASDKVVIFHIDDIGFSHASNVASFECLDFGIASCGSVIVPAPWFLETAEICERNPKYDLGVHLSLTCEYDLYRWRALSSVSPDSGLLDSQRSLWRTAEEAIQNVTPKAAENEMRAQIEMALDNGIKVSHIDTHMGTVLNPKFIMSYLKLAREYDVVAFLPRVTREELINRGLGQHADFYLKMFTKLENSGIPLLDHIVIETGGLQSNKVEFYCKEIAEIKAGLTHFLFHPAKMSLELKSITPDSAEWRNQDFEAFTNPKVKECVEQNDIKIIGYREICNYFRD